MRWLIIIALSLLPATAHATMLRYALVVGSNVGIDSVEGRLLDLSHAEREATLLHDKLVERCHFDGSLDRTILLLKPTRREFEAAVVRLAARAAADRKTYGHVDTLFAFFFTGHGLSERLLLSDGPLPKEELVDMFKRVNADMNIGIFDACFSGSVLELVPKGVIATPNPFAELPREFLNMEGSVWLASSGTNEISYEDRTLGGVFTHFFTEALDEATADGPAITFERIWEYAASKTVAHTVERGRPQNPRKVVTRLSAGGPLFFSFPNERSASLVLEDQLRGRFLLTYADGQLSEIVEKLDPGEKVLAVYPGRARLMVVEDGRAAAVEDVTLMSGASLRIGRRIDPTAPARVGEAKEELSMKGAPLRASLISKHRSMIVAAGYDYALAPRGMLIAEHASVVGLRFDDGAWIFEGTAGVGFGHEQFGAWGHRMISYLGGARAGYGVELAGVRLSALGGARLGLVEQRYDGGAERRSFSAQGELTLRGLVLLEDDIGVELNANGGFAIARGAGRDSSYLLAPWGGFGLGLFYRAW